MSGTIKRLTAGNFSPTGVISTAARSRTKLPDQPVVRFECNFECLCRQTLGFRTGGSEFKYALGSLQRPAARRSRLRLSRNAIAPPLISGRDPDCFSM
jgi:hypothetical protein